MNHNELPKHYIGGNVYAKEWQGKAGTAIQQHVHNYDHISYLAYGKVLVEVEGKAGFEAIGPTGLLIKADKEHKVTALTDCLWLCIHAIPSDLQTDLEAEDYLIDRK